MAPTIAGEQQLMAEVSFLDPHQPWLMSAPRARPPPPLIRTRGNSDRFESVDS
jgi:hypothetical protein